MMYLGPDKVFEADPLALCAAIENAFKGSHALPRRVHCDLPGDDGAKLLLMPAWLDRAALGVKIATVFPRNAERAIPTIGGLYVLLDGQCGSVRALIDGAALTAVRTAAVSALAASHLASRQAQCLLMIGTGALAPHLIRAHRAVRPIERVLVWGRNPERAAAIAASVAGLEAAAVEDLDRALAEAHIISAATSAEKPLIKGRHLKRGSHVDLVGSFTPRMREGDDRLMRRAAIVVDTPDALKESGDLIGPLKDGIIDGACIHTLADVCRGMRRNQGRGDITVFKSVGTGLADIAVALSLVQSP